ncbi:MAG: MBL fold metallo-hydrolase [Candidatus Kerfeldbacteria bacterium]
MTYTITKYAQSCFLIQKDNMRCLIDPGRFVYELDAIKPTDWPKIGLILVTHEHLDHADINGIRAIVSRDQCLIITNGSLVSKLSSQGITARMMKPGESTHAGGFHVHGVLQRHGTLSGGRPIPEDIGFIIDSTFYTPGDSVVLEDMPEAPVLFVPVAGPDMNFTTAREMIRIVKPKLAIPMHYTNTKMYPIDENELRSFSVPGCNVVVLNDKASIAWPPKGT